MLSCTVQPTIDVRLKDRIWIAIDTSCGSAAGNFAKSFQMWKVEIVEPKRGQQIWSIYKSILLQKAMKSRTDDKFSQKLHKFE